MRLEYRLVMPRFIPSYPDGFQGLALLILRLSHALAAVPVFLGLRDVPILSGAALPLAVVVGLLLLAGLGTRPAAAALACAAVWCAATSPLEPAFVFIGVAGGGGTLALLGAGAWSLDARLFGRRVIHLGGPSERG